MVLYSVDCKEKNGIIIVIKEKINEKNISNSKGLGGYDVFKYRISRT